MTRYEELAYLFGDDHLKECCDFANFLANGLALYLECTRDKIGFAAKNPDIETFTECISNIVENRYGFIYTTVAIILPNEERLGSSVFVDLRLRKIQGNFLVQISPRIHEAHLLRRETTEALNTFYESLVGEFVRTEHLWD